MSSPNLVAKGCLKPGLPMDKISIWWHSAMICSFQKNRIALIRAKMCQSECYGCWNFNLTLPFNDPHQHESVVASNHSFLNVQVSQGRLRRCRSALSLYLPFGKIMQSTIFLRRLHLPAALSKLADLPYFKERSLSKPITDQ
jgi:hypothetical protein